MTETSHVVYAGGYVVVPNSAVNDDRLSFRARGLLAYMLGRPPGWHFSAKRLSTGAYVEGREAVARALRELEVAGYYRCTRINAGGGRFRMVTEVAADPTLMPPETGYRGPVDRAPVDRAPEKQAPMSVLESQDRESLRSAEVDRVTEAAP